jgi:DNA-binding beta-propeller fold protein YncE
VAKYDLDLKYTGDEWKAPAEQGAIKPRGVTVDGSGYVYINDYRQKVQKYRPNKTFVRNMHTISENGIALNLAMDFKQNILYIAERGIDTVVSYLTSGAHNANWEVFPSGSDPVGIAVDSKRNVYVCTQAEGEQKVFVIGADGTLKGSFGFPGKGPGQFKHPVAIAIDESDNIYVLDNHPDVMDIEKWAIKN